MTSIYFIYFMMMTFLIKFTRAKSQCQSEHFPFFPSISSAPSVFLCESNGWKLFLTTENYSYYVSDPISEQKHLLPPLTWENMREVDGIHYSVVENAVMSMSPNGVVALAGIACGCNEFGHFLNDFRFCFIEINGEYQSWHVSDKICDQRMVGIAVGGVTNRLYAAGPSWRIYVLEAGPQMLWTSIDLLAPKRILDGGVKRGFTDCCGLSETSDGYLEVYGTCPTRHSSATWLVMKVKASELRIDDIEDVYCDAEWTDTIPPALHCNYDF